MSMSPMIPSESHSRRSGRDSEAHEEDTIQGIGGGEAEESLDPGIFAEGATSYVTTLNSSGDTGGEWTLTQWVHCEFIVNFEAIRLVVTQQVCGEFF